MRDKIIVAALVLAVGAMVGQTLGILPALAANPDPMISTFDLVPFRGRIEKDGLPHSDAVSLRFRLYTTDDPQDLAYFYQETIAVVQPADGNFAVVLGVAGQKPGGAAYKLSDALRENLTQRAYVGIAVDGSNNDLTGRQRLASTPYATRVNIIRAADIGNGEVGTQHLSTAGCADGQFHVKNGSGWSCERRVLQLDVGPAPPPSPSPTAIEIHGPLSGIRMTDRPGGPITAWNVVPQDGQLTISNPYNGTEALLTLDAKDNSVRLGKRYDGPQDTTAPTFGTKLRFSGANILGNSFGNDNSDEVWIGRVHSAFDHTELRVVTGDNASVDDGLTIGHMTPGGFSYDFIFNNAGDAYKSNGSGSWGVLSDERLKDIKGRFERGLKELMELRTIRFRYKPGNAMNASTDREYVGLSAQAVERVVPEAISFNKEGYRTMTNDPIVWTMLNAIQEQQHEIEGQKRAVAEQRRELESLRARLERLEARGPRSAKRH